MLKSKLALCFALATVGSVGQTTLLQANRYDSYTARLLNNPHQAEVITASYLGGEGTEWLVAGGFLPDGRVVVAGNALGPKLELLGREPLVLGRNQQAINRRAPAAPQATPQRDRSGNVRTDSNGQPRLERFNWQHPNSTGFLVLFDQNMQRIETARRFPWQAGGITSALVTEDGSVLVTGPAGEQIRDIGGDYRMIQLDHDGRQPGGIYLARITPDLSEVIWVREMNGSGTSPRISLSNDGQIYLAGPGLQVFDLDGERIREIPTAGRRLGPQSSVSPTTGKVAWGGERHWRTGREPWRCPRLNIFRPDGSHYLELYHWPGPFVGTNYFRLVSDSAVRGVAFDQQGDLFIHAWSDGGNSVMTRQPFDIHRDHRKFDEGLSYSIWGANVLSVAYIMRLNPETWEVDAGMRYVGYLRDSNRPNGLSVDSMEIAHNGAVCVAGGSAWGFIQTPNSFFPETGGGPYISIFNRDLTHLHFASVVLSAGESVLSEGRRWGVASGRVNGKDRILYLSGAIAESTAYGTTAPAPSVNPAQRGFGGGYLDGHFILLELP